MSARPSLRTAVLITEARKKDAVLRENSPPEEEVSIQHDGPNDPEETPVDEIDTKHGNDQDTSLSEIRAQYASSKKELAVLADQIKDSLLCPGCPNFRQAENILSGFEATYENPLDYNQTVALSKYYLILTRTYTALEQPDNALRTAEKVMNLRSSVLLQNRRFDLDFDSGMRDREIGHEMVIESWLHVWKARVTRGDMAKYQAQALSEAEFAWDLYHVQHRSQRQRKPPKDNEFDAKKNAMIQEPIFEGINLADAFNEANHEQMVCEAGGILRETQLTS